MPEDKCEGLLTNPSPISDKDRLNIVLKELDYLRVEILQKFDHHLQLLAIVPTALGLMVAYTATAKIPRYEILYMLPILILPITFRYLWEQHIIGIIGKYIRDELIAKRITGLVGFRNDKAANCDKYWFGYEHFWEDCEKKEIEEHNWPSYYKYTAFLIFVFIPFFPCMIYGSLFLFQNYFVGLELKSILPWPIHLIILIIYLMLSIYLSKKFL